APLPFRLDEPSTDKIQLAVTKLPFSAVISAKKSAKACAFIAPCGLKMMSSSDNSTDHVTILPAKSGSSRTFHFSEQLKKGRFLSAEHDKNL
ncbi:hypothetical protein A2U01_0073026, partial [Trifolium medium]|nr:hypothetical protein [Trifolium medium]